MANLRITKGYKRLSDASLIVKMSYILDGVKNNPYFVSPVPSMADFETAITAFTDVVATELSKSRAGARHARGKMVGWSTSAPHRNSSTKALSGCVNMGTSPGRREPAYAHGAGRPSRKSPASLVS